MIDLTWKLFSQTGNIDTYLLFKELEDDDYVQSARSVEEIGDFNYPIL